jgi:hypothetical protein
MKIKFLRGTTLAGGKPANPGEVHDVSADDAHRFVHLFRDAEYATEAPAPQKQAVEVAPEAAAAPADEAPLEEKTKGKKKL